VVGEATETFAVNLTNAGNASISDNQGTGTINDNDPPSLTINDVGVNENNSTIATATFTVTLTPAASQTVTVSFATSNGTAGAPADYAATSGSLSFPAGTTTRTITVNVAGDTLDEANETFNVNLSNATNASIVDGQGVGTINDNDTAPSFSINNVTVNESNSGTVTAGFTVSLSTASGQTVTVNYATAAGSATTPADFTAASGTLTFPAGTTSLPVNVLVVGDTLDEANETFTVNLSGATNASISDGQGLGTINDNDPPPSISIDNVSVIEGNSGSRTATFTVTLSAASGQTVTVNYATVNNTATNGDYTQRSGTLTFNPGAVTQTIAIGINGNTSREPDETFFVNLSGATNATIADSQGVGTIVNDD
jgi:hypothetical protein